MTSRRHHAGPGLDRRPDGPEGRQGAPNASDPARRRAILERVRAGIREKGYSHRTEEVYLGWARRFLRWAGDKPPAAVGHEDVRRYLRYLGEGRSLSARTVSQAASALVFLFRVGLGRDVSWSKRLPRPKKGSRKPTVLTRTEVRLVLQELDGLPHLVASLLYGSGLRISECLGLRVKDVCLESRTLSVRDGKGRKDRTTVLAREVTPALRRQMEAVGRLHRKERADGGGWAPLPTALHRSKPRAGWLLAWQYVFPSPKVTVDPKTRRRGRTHRSVSLFQRSVRRAGQRSGIPKVITCHTLRHSFATHALRAGMDARTVQSLMGHKSLRTTMIYLHPEMAGARVMSPLDLDPDY